MLISSYVVHSRQVVRIHRWQLPEAARVVCVFSLCQLFGQHHLFAVAELLNVVRHPRDRLAVAHSHIDIVLQPRVCPLNQLTATAAPNKTAFGSLSLHNKVIQTVHNKQTLRAQVTIKARLQYGRKKIGMHC